MEKAICNEIEDKNYIGIITVLDYETSVRKCLSDISIEIQNRNERRVIVNLALKVGINKYRFVVYDVTDDGKIRWDSGEYIVPCDSIVEMANSIIGQEKRILPNSMLPNSAARNLAL